MTRPQNQNKFGSNFSVKPQQGVKNLLRRKWNARTALNADYSRTGNRNQARDTASNLGIKKPGNLRSSVEEKSLKIPDFLQKK